MKHETSLTFPSCLSLHYIPWLLVYLALVEFLEFLPGPQQHRHGELTCSLCSSPQNMTGLYCADIPFQSSVNPSEN